MSHYIPTYLSSPVQRYDNYTGYRSIAPSVILPRTYRSRISTRDRSSSVRLPILRQVSLSRRYQPRYARAQSNANVYGRTAASITAGNAVTSGKPFDGSSNITVNSGEKSPISLFRRSNIKRRYSTKTTAYRNYAVRHINSKNTFPNSNLKNGPNEINNETFTSENPLRKYKDNLSYNTKSGTFNNTGNCRKEYKSHSQLDGKLENNLADSMKYRKTLNTRSSNHGVQIFTQKHGTSRSAQNEGSVESETRNENDYAHTKSKKSVVSDSAANIGSRNLQKVYSFTSSPSKLSQKTALSKDSGPYISALSIDYGVSEYQRSDKKSSEFISSKKETRNKRNNDQLNKKSKDKKSKVALMKSWFRIGHSKSNSEEAIKFEAENFGNDLEKCNEEEDLFQTQSRCLKERSKRSSCSFDSFLAYCKCKTACIIEEKQALQKKIDNQNHQMKKSQKNNQLKGHNTPKNMKASRLEDKTNKRFKTNRKEEICENRQPRGRAYKSTSEQQGSEADSGLSVIDSWLSTNQNCIRCHSDTASPIASSVKHRRSSMSGGEKYCERGTTRQTKRKSPPSVLKKDFGSVKKQTGDKSTCTG